MCSAESMGFTVSIFSMTAQKGRDSSGTLLLLSRCTIVATVAPSMSHLKDFREDFGDLEFGLGGQERHDSRYYCE